MDLIIKNYRFSTPIIQILKQLQFYVQFRNGKLSQIDEKVAQDEIRVSCPFHKGGKEHKPSCYIYIGSSGRVQYGTFHCFTCDERGPFIKFVAACLDVDEDSALDWMTKNFTYTKSSSIQLGAPIQIRRNKSDKTYLDESELSKYQDWCPYLAQRGLNRAICKKYKVKYDPDTKQVLFPCYDLSNHLVMIHKRSTESKTFYLDKDIEKPLFGLDQIIKGGYRKAIITEGPFDALKASQFGFPAFATLGMLTDAQIDIINNSGIKYLYIMFDNDAAGESFKTKLKRKLKKTILTFEPKIPLSKKDIGDLDYDEFWSSINSI